MTTTNKRFKLDRDGDRPLAFTGELIGQGRSGTGEFRRDWTRGTDVSLYRTAGGRLVAHVYRWSRWRGEDSSNTVAVCADPDELLEWLREEGGGELGSAAVEAWKDAEFPPERID